jgi:hypothetical protein
MNTFEREQFEFTPETEAFENEQFEWGGETEVFSENEVMELASELLEVSSEGELDRFLGDLIKKAGNALGQIVRSPVGQAVGSMLKGAAKQALPLAGAALGGVVGGPLGAQIGSGLASAAGDAFGLEQETMNAEDREFEGAKKFVKLAGDTVKTTLSGNPGIANALAAAQVALKDAAQKHAPALLSLPPGVRGPGMGPALDHGMGRVGRWVRHGRNIIIVNCQPTRT